MCEEISRLTGSLGCMMGIKGGVAFVGVLFAVPDAVLERQKYLLSSGTVWRESGMAGAEFGHGRRVKVYLFTY